MIYRIEKYYNEGKILKWFTTKKDAEKEAIRCLKYGDMPDAEWEDFTKYEIEKVEIYKEYKTKRSECIKIILKSMIV